jgi:predicted Fe-Mo cluster-binding NifX family protein
MKVAIPHWQGRISPLFDAADNLLLVDIEDGRELKRNRFNLKSSDPHRRAEEVSRLGADMLLCGAVSRELETALRGNGVQVVAFICGDVDGVVDALLCGRLSDARFRMPGQEKKRPPIATRRRGRRDRGRQHPDRQSDLKR